MVERKILNYLSPLSILPLRRLFGWWFADQSRLSGVMRKKQSAPKDEAYFAPETNRAILVEHYKNLGRRPIA